MSNKSYNQIHVITVGTIKISCGSPKSTNRENQMSSKFHNPCGAETGTWVNLVNTMAADAPCPCVVRSSVAMVLTMHAKKSLE